MSNEQERADFEAWANGRCELPLVSPAGRYSSAITQFAWEAYQAGRAALQLQDHDSRLFEQCKGIFEDAERYRWLRDCSDDEYLRLRNAYDVLPDGRELDAAIDHARRVEGEGK